MWLGKNDKEVLLQLFKKLDNEKQDTRLAGFAIGQTLTRTVNPLLANVENMVNSE